MAFEFKFDFLLKHRKRLEELASIEFAEARRVLDESLAHIQKMYDSIEETRHLVSVLQRGGSASDLPTIVESDQFIEGQKVRIQRERARARELMTVVEEKQTKLIEAAKEFKMIEKLQERQKKQYRKEKRKKEVKRIDDLVVIRGQRTNKGRFI